jgi:hypothetical protein
MTKRRIITKKVAAPEEWSSTTATPTTTNSTEKVIPIVRTRSGLPALWEKGGAGRNTGEVQVVADPAGNPLKPVYIRRRGTLSNSDHALVVVKPGCYVIQADQWRGDYDIVIHRIKEIRNDEAILEEVARYSEGEWWYPLKGFLLQAVDAAMEKAACYHCRSAHFIKRD